MNIKISWNAIEMRVRPQLATIQSVVTDVTWTCTAVDVDLPEYNHVSRGETLMGLPDGTNFVSYDLLDEPTIISWVHSTIGADKVKAIETEAKVRCLDMRYPSTQIVTPSWKV